MARWIETVVVRNSIDAATVAVVLTLIGDDTDPSAGNIQELIKEAVTEWAALDEGSGYVEDPGGSFNIGDLAELVGNLAKYPFLDAALCAHGITGINIQVFGGERNRGWNFDDSLLDENAFCPCGKKLKSFMHNCHGTSDYAEIHGCPDCDNRCGFCND